MTKVQVSRRVRVGATQRRGGYDGDELRNKPCKDF